MLKNSGSTSSPVAMMLLYQNGAAHAGSKANNVDKGKHFVFP
ncbi:hypothetical protein [Mucilaginibacter sp. 44-25]|nr:hypothetical protein [Mucilaginibacter sp. 44-25]